MSTSKKQRLPKRRKPLIKSKVINFTVHELFLQAITATFPDDTLSPGITTSFLPGAEPDKAFYSSLLRFPKHGEKIIVLKAHGSSLNDSIRNLAKEFASRSELTFRLSQVLYGK